MTLATGATAPRWQTGIITYNFWKNCRFAWDSHNGAAAGNCLMMLMLPEHESVSTH